MDDIDRTFAGRQPAAGLDPEAAETTPGAPAPGEASAGVPGAQTVGDGAAELAGDLDELVKVAAQRDEYLALAQRTQADFENYRKRVARDAAGAQERGAAMLAKELLPALDNLDRALEDAGTAAAGDGEAPLLEGLRLVRSEIAAALARAGIEAFRPLGEAFDPNLHEAVATVADPNGGAGSVVEVYQDGYKLGESIIRPARVVVGA